MVLSYEEIKKLLPQRYPFLMLDKVVEYEDGKNIVAVKNVTGNEIYFQGHFPEKAIMPGALIIEAMAQTAILFFKLSRTEHSQKPSVFLFAAVKSRFFKPVLPGDTLQIMVSPIKIISSGGMVDSLAMVDDEKVSKAELSFSVKTL